MGNMHEEHQEILDGINRVRDDLTRHIEEDHHFMPDTEVRKILDAQTQMLETMKAQQEVMADVVLGERKRDYDGNIVRQGGLQQIIESYNGTGGVRVQIPWVKLTGVITAVITVIGGIAVAIIEVSGGG